MESLSKPDCNKATKFHKRMAVVTALIGFFGGYGMILIAAVVVKMIME